MDAREQVRQWYGEGLLTDVQLERFELLWEQSGAKVVDVGLEEGVLCCVLMGGQTVDIYDADSLPAVTVTASKSKRPIMFLGISLKVWLGSAGFIALFVLAVVLIIKIRRK